MQGIKHLSGAQDPLITAASLKEPQNTGSYTSHNATHQHLSLDPPSVLQKPHPCVSRIPTQSSVPGSCHKEPPEPQEATGNRFHDNDGKEIDFDL